MELIIKSKKYGRQILFFDKEDIDIINSRSWWLVKTGAEGLMAVGYNKGVQENFHYLIMRDRPYRSLVHIDGNKLNNQKSNIRVIPIDRYIDRGYFIEIVMSSIKFGEHSVLVDKSDFHLVSMYKWNVVKRENTFYVSSYTAKIGEKTNGKRVLLHQLLVPNKEATVDHKNHNGLDNRRENLRKATRSQNIHNARKPKSNTSGYKGVSYYKTYKKWRVQLFIKNKLMGGGYFADIKDAALFYNKLAIQFHGDFAVLNEIK